MTQFVFFFISSFLFSAPEGILLFFYFTFYSFLKITAQSVLLPYVSSFGRLYGWLSLGTIIFSFPPPPSGRGIIGMPFVCPSDNPLVCPLHFRVRSISPEPFKRLSSDFSKMFSLQRQYAELTTQPRRPKVKVKIEDCLFEPCISCSLYISFIPERIFIKCL